MRSAEILAALAATVGVVSCSTNETPADGPEIATLPVHAGFNENPADGREITTLRVRDGFIEIRAGSTGQTFTLLDSQSRILASRLTSEEFKAKFPDRYDALERALAGLDASLDGRVWEPRAGEEMDVGFPYGDSPTR